MTHRFRPRVEALEGRDVPSATYTSLYSNPDPSFAGESVTFIATVTGGDFQPGSISFVGDTVSFYADSSPTPFATVRVQNGVASCTVLSPPPGLHTITAVYSGGHYFAGSSGLLVDDTSWSGVLFQEVDSPSLPPVLLPGPHHAHHHQAHHHAHHHRAA